MMWADRIALGVWMIGMGSAALVNLVIAINGEPVTVGHWLFVMTFLIALPLWLILRVVDFVLGGPLRRRRIRE